MKSQPEDESKLLKRIPFTLPQFDPEEMQLRLPQLSMKLEPLPEAEIIDHLENGAEIKGFIAPRKKLMFRCQSCGLRQATRNSLITHIKSHRLPFCKICLIVSNSEEQLQSHMIRGHPGLTAQLYQHNVHYVTSKYGRRRPVFETSSLVSKRKQQLKPRESFEEYLTHDELKKESTFKKIKKMASYLHSKSY